MLLRFCICRGEPFGSPSLRVFSKFCSSGSLEGFPPDEVVATFCFPLRAEVTAAKHLATHEEYSFSMTMGTGARVHAFCRRFHPLSSTGARYPTVLCLMSEGLWGTMLWKALEVLEQVLSIHNLVANSKTERLSSSSPASWFLRFLGLQLSTTPRPGQILRIPFPNLESPLDISPQRRVPALGEANDPLQCTDKFIELQVPPLLGGDFTSAGVSIGSLVWRIPVPCLMTLIAGLLLERRILLVSRRKDVLSSAIHAAAALVYPFKWHHVYLPIVPETLKEYVMAPMPFLIGIPAQLLASVRGLQMSEVTIVDLDLGKCEPNPGSDGDDAQILPMRAKLEEAIRGAISKLESPQEFEGNLIFSGIMTDYFVKLFKGYRKYIKQFPGDMCGKNKPIRSKSNVQEHDTLRGEHHYFDFPAFVQSRGKSDTKQFMMLFRQSQMFEVMIQDRLELAGQWHLVKEDFFEQKIALVDSHEFRSMDTLRKPVRSLSKTLSLKRSKRRLMVSHSDKWTHALHPDMVSVLASSALKQAISEESSTIRVSSPPSSQYPEPSMSAMDSVASSLNSGWQSDIESAAENQLSEASQAMEESLSVTHMSDLICLEDSDDASLSQDPSQLDENPFGEPDAFPQLPEKHLAMGHTDQINLARGDYSSNESQIWDERPQSGFGASMLRMGNAAEAEKEATYNHLEAQKSASASVHSGTVCWSQLIDGLVDNGAIAEASQREALSNPPVARDSDVLHSAVSPFMDTSDGSGPVLDLDLPHQRNQEFGRRMSRVESLRVKSQKHLEEMFTANLKLFDSSTSAAAHPGSVPWILPRNQNLVQTHQTRARLAKLSEEHRI